MATISSFRSIENKHDEYRGKIVWKRFVNSKEGMKWKKLKLKRKKMKLLTKEQQESYENAKICHICKGKFESKYLKDKKYQKVRNYCHYAGNIEVLYIAYVI